MMLKLSLHFYSDGFREAHLRRVFRSARMLIRDGRLSLVLVARKRIHVWAWGRIVERNVGLRLGGVWRLIGIWCIASWHWRIRIGCWVGIRW